MNGCKREHLESISKTEILWQQRHNYDTFSFFFHCKMNLYYVCKWRDLNIEKINK